MLELVNDQLKIALLDPVADRDRFGIRYCTGGYIFAVHDHRFGNVMRGPTWPDSFNWFDGQGIPDAFNLGPIHSTERLGEALIIGIGECDLSSRRVLSFCEWRVTRDETSLTFSTAQAYGQRALTLARTVSLAGRTLRSRTTLTNTGRFEVPVRWFPHPFYPQPAGDELLWVNAPLRWPAGDRANAEAPAYVQQANGFIARKGWPWSTGHYRALDHDATAPLVLLQRHPDLGLIGAACSYVPGFFPIWGNERTFSWEPFLERLVAPGQTLDWWIDYFF